VLPATLDPGTFESHMLAIYPKGFECRENLFTVNPVYLLNVKCP
jgi:hypothetical protein